MARWTKKNAFLSSLFCFSFNPLFLPQSATVAPLFTTRFMRHRPAFLRDWLYWDATVLLNLKWTSFESIILTNVEASVYSVYSTFSKYEILQEQCLVERYYHFAAKLYAIILKYDFDLLIPWKWLAVQRHLVTWLCRTNFLARQFWSQDGCSMLLSCLTISSNLAETLFISSDSKTYVVSMKHQGKFA